MLCCLAGCGRIDFDARADGGAAGDGSASLDPTICDDGLPGVLFCESFEGAPQLTTVEAAAPTYVVADGSEIYRGQRALHSHSTRLGEPAWILGGALPAIMSGEVWARWYLYVPSEPVVIDMASVHIVDMQAPNNGMVFGFTDTFVQIWSTEAAMAGNFTYAFPRDRWVCVRQHIVIADAGGSVETWLDATPGPAMTGIDTLPAGGYTNVHAGMWASNIGSAPMDLQTDELVIGRSSIPCD